MTLTRWTAIGPRYWRARVHYGRPVAPDLFEELAQVPGVTVHATGTLADVTAHETCFVTDPVRRFCSWFDVELLPATVRRAISTRDVALRRVLRPYQQDGADWLAGNGGGVLGDEMGLGKTTTSLVAAEALRLAHAPDAPVLIVGPKFTRDVWRREIEAVFHGPGGFYACEGMTPGDREEQLARARWWFCHYEILDGWRAVFTRPLYGQRPLVTIFDEAHWIKNPKSKRGKAALAVGPLARHRLVLTGTPLLNVVTDLWPLLTIADGSGSWGTSFGFADRYTLHEKTAYGWTSTGTRHEPELFRRLDGSYLRRTVAQVGTELPRFARERFVVPPSADVPAALRPWCGGSIAKGLARFRTAFEQGDLGPDTLRALMAWRKATGDAKLPVTIDLATSILAEGEKVVVFAWRKETVEKVARKLREAFASDTTDDSPVVHVVHGDIDQKYRDVSVAEFQAMPGPGAIVATIDSLKEGVTLHAARRLILHDLHWIPAVMLQAEARIYRIGQTRPVLVTWVVQQDSVDEVIAEHLAAKADTIDLVLRDPAAKVAIAEGRPDAVTTSGARFARSILGDDE